MARFLFYAYPSFPYSSYTSPAETSFHRPPFTSPFSRSSAPRSVPASTRSIINVPVSDSTSLRPSFPPTQPVPAAVAHIDPSSAATTIQSHFRGFCVRRHRPLLHLRTIARALKQLRELQSELERPEFSLKVKENERERLRFSESIMSIILRLDAIEGSMAEVRIQRKEATKKAIKLQEAIDAIMIQKDESAAFDLPADEGGMTPSDDSVLMEHPQEHLHPVADMVEKEVDGVPALDIDVLQDEHLLSEDNAAGTLPNNDDTSVVDMGAAEGVVQQGESGLATASQVQHVKSLHMAEPEISHSTDIYDGSDAVLRGDAVSTCAAKEAVGNNTELLHSETQENRRYSDSLGNKVDQDGHVQDGVLDAGHGYAKMESADGAHTWGMDVVQEGISQNSELCPSTPTADDQKCDHSRHVDAAGGNEFQGTLEGLERPTLEEKCSLNGHRVPSMHGYEEHSNEAHQETELKANGSTLSRAEAPSMPESNASLRQISEDCRQLKALVGKLLVQNKAQSNVLGAIAGRLEMLEHQNQLNCCHNQQTMREKRKLKKGLKRVVKRRNCDKTM